MAARLVAGMDLGSTSMKLLVCDEDGAELLVEEVPTPWRAGPGGTADLPPDCLVAAVGQLLAGASRELAGRADARVTALAIAGMGETGMVVDEGGTPVAPAFAWFDPRGAAQVAAFPAEVRAQFAGRTGLPLGPQASVAKLAYLREQGLVLDGLRWLNLPEFVVTTLGGQAVAELSLASRTGLLDQDTGAPWPAMLAALGVTADFLPPLVAAGTDLGRIADGLPFAGARLTVAGHDHLVAAEADGPIPAARYHVSMGTAEVLLRVIDAPLGYAARARLAEHLINEVRHVVPGKHVLVAGLKTGLLLRRTLQTLGIRDRDGRDRLDAAVMAIPHEGTLPAGGIEVTGARNDDGVLALTVRTDDVRPAEVFAAVLRHSNDEIVRLVDAMDAEIPPATSATLTGGWAAMAAVRRARVAVLPDVAVSTRQQETAFGAARVAARLLLTEPIHSGGNMNPLTTRERRGMTAISTAACRMLIVAADQRNSMKAVMTDDPGAVSDAELAAAKADLVRYLASSAPAILLDPEIALPGVVDDGTLARGTALVVGMDASGYETVDGLRYTRFVPGVTARRVRELGGDVAKMLFYVRPDRQGADSVLAEQMRELVRDCAEEGILLIVELLTYQLDGESDDAYRAAFPGLVADGARLAVACGAKTLKLQYPGSAEGCAAVTAAAAGVPWAVLSAGVDHATFLEQVRTAMANGASGAMAGRSLWKDSLSTSAATRQDHLTNRALPRLRELAAVVDGRAS
ncbi:MAG TPA: FGGY family carbohydrate kinase [Pseudonocardia sp.]|nr:FGGY family carbohydrate kinase [Pseudonocardia sp.]